MRSDRAGRTAIEPRLRGMDLTDALPYLLRRAHFEAEAAFAELFGSRGITSRQAALLLTVLQQPGISQARLADQLGLDANTLGSIVARVGRRRLIRRERLSGDQRSYGLHVTDAGVRELAGVLPGIGRYQQRLTRRLTVGERRQLVVLLRRLLGLDG